MRILAVDPGEKRLGLALSDPTGTIANPLTVLSHRSRAESARRIAQIAAERGAGQIIVGQSPGAQGESTPSVRRAASLARAIQAQTAIPVELWDETGSTQAARAAGLALGVPRKKRRGHLDAIAATVILQSYLDRRQENPQGHPRPQ